MWYYIRVVSTLHETDKPKQRKGTVYCMKASFISSTKTYDGKLKYLVYSYRGYEYMITDYGWYGNGSISESLKYQHEQEQHKIDERIKQEKYREEHKEEFESLTTVDEDLDYFFKMIGWDE